MRQKILTMVLAACCITMTVVHYQTLQQLKQTEFERYDFQHTCVKRAMEIDRLKARLRDCR